MNIKIVSLIFLLVAHANAVLLAEATVHKDEHPPRQDATPRNRSKSVRGLYQNEESMLSTTENGDGDLGDIADGEEEEDEEAEDSGESFFELANRRVLEIRNQNRILLDKSIETCPYAPSPMDEKLADEAHNVIAKKKKGCIVGNYTASGSDEQFLGRTSDRLFMYDALTIGQISSSDSTLKLFGFNLIHKTISHIKTKHFYDEIPVDACADKFKNIFVVFPDQNKIGKYQLYNAIRSSSSSASSSSSSSSSQTSSSPHKSNKTRLGIKETMSVKDVDFNPSSIACHDDLIYVGERPSKQVRVYDKYLNLIRIIHLNALVVSAHHGLAMSSNVRVVLDGLDGIGLFYSNGNNGPHKRKLYSKLVGDPTSESSRPHSSSHNNINNNNNNNNRVCHFFQKMGCLEDVDVYAESKSRSSIYLVNSCDAAVVEFTFGAKDEKIQVNRKFSITKGVPISATRNSLGYLFVLTDNPRQIITIDTRNCA